MATLRVMHDLGCACGRHFRRPLFHAIDVAEQPGLRYALLAGVFNAAQCPSCERTASVDLAFLYRDEARGHLFQVRPDDGGDESDVADLDMLADALGASQAEGLRRAAVMTGVEPLVELIAAELDEDEQPGSIEFDVRPGIASERAARLMAGHIAAGVDGYVHAWREGGRLHLDVLGPTAKLEAITIVAD